jgi:hypothetical protein
MLDSGEHFGENGIVRIRNDQRDGAGSVEAQRDGTAVRDISEPLGDLEDSQAGVLTHSSLGVTGECPGRNRFRHARGACDIVEAHHHTSV